MDTGSRRCMAGEPHWHYILGHALRLLVTMERVTLNVWLFKNFAMLAFKHLAPGFGLETTDVDLSQPIDAPLFAEIERAFYRAQVLVLRGQRLRPKYQLRLTYGVGDVVMWDNPSLLHAATLTDPKFPRTLHRITVKVYPTAKAL